jgi:hypothetical protein
MPPKEAAPKKPPTQVARPPISDTSLVYVPDDAVQGDILCSNETITCLYGCNLLRLRHKNLPPNLWDIIIHFVKYLEHFEDKMHHWCHTLFIPEEVAEISQIFLRDTHVLPKLVSCEEHCRRDRW